jgi:hypothetical protein
VQAEGNWVIYPDPFSNELTVDNIAHAYNVQAIVMYDMLGRAVINESTGNLGNSEIRLNVSALSKGMYFLMIKTDSINYMQKVVKQ